MRCQKKGQVWAARLALRTAVAVHVEIGADGTLPLKSKTR